MLERHSKTGFTAINLPRTTSSAILGTKKRHKNSCCTFMRDMKWVFFLLINNKVNVACRALGRITSGKKCTNPVKSSWFKDWKKNICASCLAGAVLLQLQRLEANSNGKKELLTGGVKGLEHGPARSGFFPHFFLSLRYSTCEESFVTGSSWALVGRHHGRRDVRLQNQRYQEEKFSLSNAN